MPGVEEELLPKSSRVVRTKDVVGAQVSSEQRQEPGASLPLRVSFGQQLWVPNLVKMWFRHAVVMQSPKNASKHVFRDTVKHNFESNACHHRNNAGHFF